MSLLSFLTRFADPRVEAPQERPGAADHRALALVVDDDPGMRSLMTLSLEQCGYEVIEVASGQEAIVMSRHVGRIDLIVVDLELRGVRGTAVVDTLRALNGYVPVVYVSDRSDGIVGVADPVLRKPFLCGEWLRAVGNVVGVLPKDKRVAA